MIIKLLGYAPDADENIVGVITNCSGAIPSLRGMKSAPSPETYNMQTLPATCQGAALISLLDGTNRIFAGTPAAVYEAGASTWSSVGWTTYTTSSTGKWRFAQQGDATIATNGAETCQVSVTSGSFSALAGAPIAQDVEAVNQFIVAFNTSSSEDEWHCCALGNFRSWTASTSTQAAKGNLIETPGPITGGKRFGDSVIAFKKNSMYRGRYVSAPNVFEFDLIPGEAGALSKECIVDVGTPDAPKLLFMGERDFYSFDGSRPVPIGTGWVKEEVYNSLLQSRYYACQAQHDPSESIVRFWYPVSDSVFPDKCVVYNYKTGRWGRDDRQIQAALQFVPAAITYTTLGDFYATYEVLPNLTYGTAFLGSSLKTPAIINMSQRLQTLTGAPASSSITTGDIGDDESMYLLCRVRPRFLTKPTNASLVNYYRDSIGESLTADATTGLSDDGSFDLLREARWHRVKMDFTGSWEMSAFNAEYKEMGLE